MKREETYKIFINNSSYLWDEEDREHEVMHNKQFHEAANEVERLTRIKLLEDLYQHVDDPRELINEIERQLKIE